MFGTVHVTRFAGNMSLSPSPAKERFNVAASRTIVIALSRG